MFKTSGGSDQLYLVLLLCQGHCAFVCLCVQVCGTDARLQARAGASSKVRLSLLYSPDPTSSTSVSQSLQLSETFLFCSFH